MLRKIKIFGRLVLEIETEDKSPESAPDFISHAHQAGFVRTAIIPDKLHEEKPW